MNQRESPVTNKSTQNDRKFYALRSTLSISKKQQQEKQSLGELKMRSIFQKYQTDDQHVNNIHLSTFEFRIPETFFERLKGVHLFNELPKHTALIFRTPCALHTFGLRHPLWLTLLDEHMSIIGDIEECPPNRIILAFQTAGWIAEFTHRPALAESKSHFKVNQCQIKIIKIPLLSSERLNRIIHRIYPLFISLLVFLCLILSLVFSAMGFAASGPIKLPIGESKEVTLDEAPRSLDISQPDVIDVQRIGATNKILVSALRSGTSRLTARFNNGENRQWSFSVGIPNPTNDIPATLSSGSLIRLARDIQRRTGLETVIDNGRIVIFGYLQNEAQFKAIVDVCFGRDECLPRYAASEEALRLQTKFMQTLFKNLGYSGLTVEASLGGLVIKGSTENPEALEKFRRLTSSILSKVTESITVDKSGESLIETQLTFLRMSANKLTSFGLSTTQKNADSGSELVRAGLPTFLKQWRDGPKISMNFPDLVLNALAQKGVVQQLARPTIVISSGGKGEVQTGGELLFQSKGEHQKFFVQSYGLIVTLQPRLSGTGLILQKVDIKLSNPQANPNPNSVSSFDQSVLTTEIGSKPNQQILLTRINQQFSGKSVSKIPIIGHIPIIGELFKSRELISDDSELWIAIKSSIGEAATVELPIPEQANSPETPSAHWLD
jgi:pilus assembly protein CpaC